jgi:hypothetical protein
VRDDVSNEEKNSVNISKTVETKEEILKKIIRKYEIFSQVDRTVTSNHFKTIDLPMPEANGHDNWNNMIDLNDKKSDNIENIMSKSITYCYSC